MFVLRLIVKILSFPVILILSAVRGIMKLGVRLSSFVLGSVMLLILGGIIYTIVQRAWNPMWILLAAEISIIVIAFFAGVIDYQLESAIRAMAAFKVRRA